MTIPVHLLRDDDGAHVTYDLFHAAFLKCLHQQCLGFGGRGEFLGYISPATITAAGGRSALITPPLERSQKCRFEISPISTKRPFTSSGAVWRQSLTSDVGPPGPEPASAAVGVHSYLSACVLPASSNDDVMDTTSNSAAVSGGSTVQLTLKQGPSRIYECNQQKDDRPITGGHEKTCEYGGRVGETINTACSTLPVTDSLIIVMI